MKSVKVFVFVIALVIPAIGHSLDFKARVHREGIKDRKQFCYTDFVIDQAGNWNARTLFSNGKRIDGDHFVAIMQLVDSAGNVVASIKHAAGVNGSFGGSARERAVSSRGKVDRSLVLRIDEDKTKYSCTGHDAIPDERLGGIVLDIIKMF